LIKKLTELNRVSKQLIMVFVDSVLTVAVLLSSFAIRLGYWYWPSEEIFWIIFGAPVIAIPVFISFRLYRSVVRYIGFRALSSFAQAVTLYAVVWGLISLMSNHPVIMSVLGLTSDPFAYTTSGIVTSGSYFAGIPRSVILINWMLALIVIGGSRL
jgi:FlaA1/EpsC-like NDP-sugar epimerase